MASSRQASFAQVEWSGRKRRTARARFLEQMDSVVPWADLVAIVEPHAPPRACAGAGSSQNPNSLVPPLHLRYPTPGGGSL